ncbi:winged helix-turn-helix domain-containing protein, partial [Rhizobiaceae sp. 2RAB30]
DVPVAVGYRALKLLEALVGRSGEILAKAELMDAAWPGMAVEEGNLTVQIALLRKLLGPAAEGGEWISTVPRVGYRFAGAVEQLGGANRKPLPLPDKPSIAVLPFVNVGNDPEQESFADGLTEDLITDLSRSGLFVIARNSAFAYKGKAMDVRGIAED